MKLHVLAVHGGIASFTCEAGGTSSLCKHVHACRSPSQFDNVHGRIDHESVAEIKNLDMGK